MCNSLEELNPEDDQFSSGFNTQEVNSAINLSSIERVRSNFFISLAAQFAILEAVSSSQLLLCNDINSINFYYVIDNALKYFGGLPTFDVSWNQHIITQLRAACVENNDLSSEFGLMPTENEYVQEIDRIEYSLSDLFQQLQGVIPEYQGEITMDQRRTCTQVFDREHCRAKNWLSKIITETTESAKATIAFENIAPPLLPNAHPDNTKLLSLAFSTEARNNFRYIKVQFSLQNSKLEDFLLLAFKLLHEYFSHFYACGSINGELYRRVDSKFKDGWLFHTIEEFCRENADDLFGAGNFDDQEFYSLEGSKCQVINHIKKYISHLCCMGTPTYIPESEVGYNIASKFLKFLNTCFSQEQNGDNKARLLYYRFSWDLIQRSPIDGFSQGKFIDFLEIALSKNSETKNMLRDRLIDSIVVENNKEFIDIENFWIALNLLAEYKTIDEQLQIQI